MTISVIIIEIITSMSVNPDAGDASATARSNLFAGCSVCMTLTPSANPGVPRNSVRSPFREDTPGGEIQGMSRRMLNFG